MSMIQSDNELEGRYLHFFIDGVIYGLPLSIVLEIMNIQTITQVPDTADYIRGVVNLRGKIVPVVDTRTKLGLPTKEFDDKTCIIVVDVEDMRIGLIVDSVSEVVSIDPDTISAPPTAGDKKTLYLDSVTEFDGKVILNLGIEKFLASDLTNITTV
ncbi:MAG: purine-binding chemotaxis protein CheW [Ruminococcaceae bacterium]|nr:purine-binding chemotaxis protein CheW [Oscillospiraceae bacterium]